MRVLVTTCPPLGHVLPVVPIAQSLAKAGHEVRWATGADALPVVKAAGLAVDACGLDALQRRAVYFDQFPEARSLAPEDLPSHMFPRLFGAVSAPAMIDGLLPLAERWQPDVILHETGELAAPIVAA